MHTFAKNRIFLVEISIIRKIMIEIMAKYRKYKRSKCKSKFEICQHRPTRPVLFPKYPKALKIFFRQPDKKRQIRQKECFQVFMHFVKSPLTPKKFEIIFFHVQKIVEALLNTSDLTYRVFTRIKIQYC